MATVRFAALGLAALALAGCVAAPTPYAPVDPAAGYATGYAEAAIEANRFRVSFAANAITPEEQVADYLLYRAAEITIAEGADWFRIDAEGLEPEIRYFSRGPVPLYTTRLFVARSYGKTVPDTGLPATATRGREASRVRIGFGFGYGFGYPFGYPYYYTPRVTRIEAEAEIRIFPGEKPPEDPAAYDAAAVIDAIGPRIVRPSAG